MVRIVNYQKRVSDEGKEFFVLEITGGIEMVRSQETGQFYATTKKATVSSTFDEPTCKGLIGTEMPGKIVKQSVVPYPYVIRETGEEIILNHKWMYSPDEDNIQQPSETTEFKADINAFSTNGHAQLVEAK